MQRLMTLSVNTAMLQYLIIILDDTATSYCHYENPKTVHRLIPIDVLKAGILFGMKENLMIQFVYPDYSLPSEYADVVESIDHSKIVSSLCEDDGVRTDADVIVLHSWSCLQNEKLKTDKKYVLRTTKADLFERYAFLEDSISQATRLNVVITDLESFSEDDIEAYKKVLAALSEYLVNIYIKGASPQLNLLTDRMMLTKMNNCGAGETNITLAPNGRFYDCPAFYYENEADSIGDLEHGLDIKNKQLYKLDHAPICRHCDAYQCKRCIWLNRKTTLEVNTPSHEQCVVAHLERNASRELLDSIRKHGEFLQGTEISEIDYLDPFDKREEW